MENGKVLLFFFEYGFVCTILISTYGQTICRQIKNNQSESLFLRRYKSIEFGNKLYKVITTTACYLIKLLFSGKIFVFVSVSVSASALALALAYKKKKRTNK